MKYLPYDESITEQKQHDPLLNKETKKGKSTATLSPGIKTEMIQSFMPSISKQLDVMNTDEIIRLLEKLEEYNKVIKNEQLSEYCTQLSGYIQSFNISEINKTLKKISAFINY